MRMEYKTATIIAKHMETLQLFSAAIKDSLTVSRVSVCSRFDTEEKPLESVLGNRRMPFLDIAEAMTKTLHIELIRVVSETVQELQKLGVVFTVPQLVQLGLPEKDAEQLVEFLVVVPSKTEVTLSNKSLTASELEQDMKTARSFLGSKKVAHIKFRDRFGEALGKVKILLHDEQYYHLDTHLCKTVKDLKIDLKKFYDLFDKANPEFPSRHRFTSETDDIHLVTIFLDLADQLVPSKEKQKAGT